MKLHTIEVDTEVYEYLKKRAEPFVDTPNTVLRRELLGRSARAVETARSSVNGVSPLLPTFPRGTPQALRQILEVAFLVRRGSRSRPDATTAVARHHSVAPQTVTDKYTRQLGMTAAEFDRLLEENAASLRALLIERFEDFEQLISEVLQ